MLQKQAVLSLVQYSIQNLLCVKAKMHAPSPVFTTSFTIPTIIMLFNHFPGAALTRKFLNAVVHPKAEDSLAYRKEVMHMVKAEKLYIIVEDGRVTEIWYDDSDYDNQDYLLTEGTDYVVEYVQKRTERCQVCDRTYPASEIVTRDGEQLCQQCDLDKYPIRPEDIPF